MTLRALVATALVGAGVAVLPAPPATAEVTPRGHDGACAPDDDVGVTIVVDFQDLGGGVNVRCTERPPTDGADALDAAGISWQGVVRWGRGFVCKIAGKPADDPCIDTPPASAYWSYWLAPRGGRWCYSNLGVLNRRPPPGTVEGWSFSLDRDGGQSPPPRMAPPALAPGLRPNPLGADDCDPSGGDGPSTTTPTTAPPTTDRPGGGGGSTAVPLPGDPSPPGGGGDGDTDEPGDGSDAAPDGEDPATAGPGGSSPSTTGDHGSSTASPAEPGEDDRDAAATGAEAEAGGPGGSGERATGVNPTDLSSDGSGGGGGFPVSTGAGIGAVLALAAGGAVVARRRRTGGGTLDGAA
ncbi:MAG TPA: hypothetical protein VFU19_19560 [Iamia sp.]|nr:hypothetical protein [Iamia sp.]